MTQRLSLSPSWKSALASDQRGLVLDWGRSLASLTTLRVGGPAQCFAEVTTVAALRRLLAFATQEQIPFFLLGQGSNVLIPDEGLPGITARLGGYFRRIRFVGDRVAAGGAVSLAQLARKTAQRGLLGLEALSGFPSTVGGAVFMNAGCYGTEITDVLIRAAVVARDGRRRLVRPPELEPQYRRTVLQDTGEIVVRASFQLCEGESERALERIQELNRKRWDSLPSGAPNAGSVFRNPEGDYAGRLIEAVGLKGATRGAAQISERHANVIVNRGGASAGDVMELMELAAERVRKDHGVVLHPEVVLAGKLRERWRHRNS